MRGLFTSTVARLALAIFVLQILSSGAAIQLLRNQMTQIVQADRTRQVLDVRDDLLAAYYDGGNAGLSSFITERRGSAADPMIFVALSGQGKSLLSNIASLPRHRVTRRPELVEVSHGPGAPVTQGLAIATMLDDGSELVVGASTVTDRAFDIAFAEAAGLTLALTVVLALFSAVALGLVISRRTHGIAETAEALAQGNFTARVPREDIGDGFDHLRRQINLMAQRIDDLIKQLQSISGALAHDLQSPVARLRASIETAQAAAGAGAAGDALALARADAEALQAMLATALELNRLESGAIADRRQLIDLGEVVADMAELYEPLAEQSGVVLDCAIMPVQALVDRELMSRALANLIDNALKYGGDHITIACGEDGAGAAGGAVLTVRDNGPGIAEADRAMVTNRFTRLDNARTRPGAGLGLAMVAAVAQIHGGTLDLSDAGGEAGRGLVAAIRIPRA